MMDTLTGKFGPREIALAFAFGILIGLIPKGNLLVALLALLFFFSRANFPVGILVLIVTSLAAPWSYSFAHKIGLEILASTFGQDWGGRLFQIPLVPWTMLDNTVVLGSFLIGLVQFLPVFLLIWIPLKLIWPKKKTEENAIDENDKTA